MKPRLPDICRQALEVPLPVERNAPAITAPSTHIVDALRYIDPSCVRVDWVPIGLALRNHFGDDRAGFELYDRWSSGGLLEPQAMPGNYEADTIEHQWASFKPEGGVTLGTLFYRAMSAGWSPPTSFDAAAVFADMEGFGALVDRILSSGGDPKETGTLSDEIECIKTGDLQRGVLTALLSRELKGAGLLTKKVRETLSGPEVVHPEGVYTKNHTKNAFLFLQTHYPNDTLRRSLEVWYAFDGRTWAMPTDAHVRHSVTMALASSWPQYGVISGTYGVLSELTFSCQPVAVGMPPGQIIMQNGILDTETRQLNPHDKKYFTTSILPFGYAPEVRCDKWVAFLEQVFEGDHEKMGLLQEWFGYLISGGHEHHKVMLLLGPTRCGKGTVGRMLRALVGEEGFTGGSLALFASDEYLNRLRTRSVVFIGDAEKTIPGALRPTVVSRIKEISGGDEVAFDRKFKSVVSCRLPSRITLAANSVPKLFDDSNALALRLLVLTFEVSFYGREDLRLSLKLLPEVAGVANWALSGLDRLNASTKFTCPKDSKDEVAYIQEEYSPISLFLEAVCVLGGSAFVESKDVYLAYCTWAAADAGGGLLRRTTFIGSFKDTVRGTGCRYHQQRSQVDGRLKRGFTGLVLRPLPVLGCSGGGVGR